MRSDPFSSVGTSLWLSLWASSGCKADREITEKTQESKQRTEKLKKINFVLNNVINS